MLKYYFGNSEHHSHEEYLSKSLKVSHTSHTFVSKVKLHRYLHACMQVERIAARPIIIADFHVFPIIGITFSSTFY